MFLYENCLGDVYISKNGFDESYENICYICGSYNECLGQFNNKEELEYLLNENNFDIEYIRNFLEENKNFFKKYLTI